MGMGGGNKYLSKFWWVTLCNANLICYDTQLPEWGRLFRFFFLRSTLTNYCKHFPKSICGEFISPVGYFFNKPVEPL